MVETALMKAGKQQYLDDALYSDHDNYKGF
jgi:hypothetical protein